MVSSLPIEGYKYLLTRITFTIVDDSSQWVLPMMVISVNPAVGLSHNIVIPMFSDVRLLSALLTSRVRWIPNYF